VTSVHVHVLAVAAVSAAHYSHGFSDFFGEIWCMGVAIERLE